MTDSLLTAGDVEFAETAPVLRRMFPGMDERPALFRGVGRQGYTMVTARDETYIGFSDDNSLSKTIEFVSEPFSDSIIDMSRSFVNVNLRAEVQIDGGAWTTPTTNMACSLANGAGALIMRTSETRINSTLVSDDGDAQEDGCAATSFVQMLAQAKGSDVRPCGPVRAWAVPGPTAEGSGGPAQNLAREIQPGAYYPGSVPGAGNPPPNSGLPRAVAATLGASSGNPDGWALCDDFNGGQEQYDVTFNPNFGENTTQTFGASRYNGALALQSCMVVPSQTTAGGSAIGFAAIRAKPGSSIWRSGMTLPPGCTVQLRFDLSQAQRYIHSQYHNVVANDGAITATRAYIYQMTLWLYTIRPKQIFISRAEERLAATGILMPVVNRRVFATQLQNGVSSVAYSGLFPGVMPSRCWAYLTRSHGQGGMNPQDLSRFSAFACSPYGRHDGILRVADPAVAIPAGFWADGGSADLLPYINRASIQTPDGRQYPENGYDSGLTVNDSQRRYLAYLEACDDPKNAALSYKHYAMAYPVLVFDIDQNTAGEPSAELEARLGTPVSYSTEGLTLRMDFSTPVTQTPQGGLVNGSDQIPPTWLILVAESAAGISFRTGGKGEPVMVERVAF